MIIRWAIAMAVLLVAILPRMTRAQVAAGVSTAQNFRQRQSQVRQRRKIRKRPRPRWLCLDRKCRLRRHPRTGQRH